MPDQLTGLPSRATAAPRQETATWPPTVCSSERLFDYHRAHPEALRLLLWEALELGDEPVPGEEDCTRHYQDKLRAARPEDGTGDPRARLFFTLGLVGWSLAMPQLRRMILGPDHTLDGLRTEIADAVRALPAGDGRAERP